MSQSTPEFLHIQRLVGEKIAESPIYAFLLEELRVSSVNPGHVVVRLTLGKAHMNSKGSLHGSVTATIVDFMGGMAIASFDMRRSTGVSVDIHVTYQSGAKVGDDVEIEAIAEKVGGSLAFTRINIFSLTDSVRGRIVATGTHTKFVKENTILKS